MFGEESEGKWVQNTVGHVVFTIRRVVKTDRQQEQIKGKEIRGVNVLSDTH